MYWHAKNITIDIFLQKCYYNFVMIKMNFPRDKKGFYIIQKQTAKDKAVINTSDSVCKSDNFWYPNDRDEKILMKFEPNEASIMTLCGELLFSHIAKNNNYPCADIDIGRFDTGEYVALSKNVVDDKAEPLYCNTIFDFYDCNYADRIPTVENIFRLVDAYAYDNGIKTDPKLKTNLYKMALVDFLTNQDDRNFSNFMFQIKDCDGEKIIHLCDLFDNEGVFEFMQLYFNNNICELFKNKEFEDDVFYDLQKDFQTALKNSKENSLLDKTFGIETDVQDMVNSINIYENVVGTRKRETIKKIFYNEMAEVLLKNEELMQFFNNFKYNADEVGAQIYNEIGFVMPQELLKLSQYQFDFRKKEIIKALESKIENEMGEE